MALDKATRNTLRNMVIRCRRLLEDAVGDMLEGKLGIRRSGEIEDAARMTHLLAEEHEQREQVISHLRHIEADGLQRRATILSHCLFALLMRRLASSPGFIRLVLGSMVR